MKFSFAKVSQYLNPADMVLDDRIHVGLDIGQGGVKAVQLNATGRGLSLSAAGLKEILPDSGEEIWVQAITELWREQKFKSKQVLSTDSFI